MKIRYSRLAKNAFVIQHLLHYSIVYTFTHYRTIMMDGCHTHNTGNILSISKNFYLLNFYNYLFFLSFLGKYFLGTQKNFLELKKIFWDQWFPGPILFPALLRYTTSARLPSHIPQDKNFKNGFIIYEDS